MIRPGIVLYPGSFVQEPHCNTGGKTIWNTQLRSLEKYPGVHTYLDRLDLPIHKLVLRSCSLESLPCEVHGIPRVVDLLQDLHGNHSLNMVRQFVNVGKMVNHVGPRGNLRCIRT